ncbi:hypothetical protein ACOME3_007558 [Neoechinorhynchus agilis]
MPEALGSDPVAADAHNRQDFVPPLEDIQPVVLYDSNIAVEEYDIVTGIKGSDRKSKSDSAEVTTKKATVEETSGRVVTRAKGGTPSKSINPSIHFGSLQNPDIEFIAVHSIAPLRNGFREFTIPGVHRPLAPTLRWSSGLTLQIPVRVNEFEYVTADEARPKGTKYC